MSDETEPTEDERERASRVEFNVTMALMEARGDLLMVMQTARELDEDGRVPGSTSSEDGITDRGWYLFKRISDGWHAEGCPRFVLSASVASLLVSTKAPEVTEDTLQSPYDVMLVEVPGEWTSLPGTGPLFVLLTRMNLDETPATLIVVGRRYPPPPAAGSPQRKEEERPQVCARLLLGTRSLDETHYDPYRLRDGGRAPPYFTEAVRYLVNTCCMVTAYRESAPKRVGKNAPKGAVIHDVRPPLDVAVTADFRRYAANLVADRRIAERKDALLHIVRGHWKRQVVGSGRSDRELIWIKPYQRGVAQLGRVIEKVINIGGDPVDAARRTKH